MTDENKNEVPEPVPTKPPFLSDKAYDVLKWVTIYAIGPLTALTAGIGTIWGIDVMQPVAATIGLAGTALAGILGYSNARYNASK